GIRDFHVTGVQTCALPILGGNASSEIRMHIVGASAMKQVWRETGIIEELMLTESVTNPQASYEMLDYVLYDKVFSNKNITLLLRSEERRVGKECSARRSA